MDKKDEIFEFDESGSEETYVEKIEDVIVDEDRIEVLDDPEVQAEADPLAEKDAKIAELTDKWQRTLAEFDNFRKRTLKEKASMYDEGVKETLEKLLPVIDNLERALSSVTNQEDALYKGVSMTFRQIEEILESMGVEPIASVGETFDPNRHSAVAHVQDDNYGENEVIEDLQKGYMYKDKVLRYSMVKVAN